MNNGAIKEPRTLKENKMSSSESEDDSARLREAVDPNLLTGGLYHRHPHLPAKLAPPADKPLEAQETCKAGKSLRRDKAEPEVRVLSDLEVTPQFQTFVAGQLDRLLEQHIVEVEQPEAEDEEMDGKEVVVEKAGREPGIRLLASSLRPVEVVSDRPAARRRKPDLLAHRKVTRPRRKRRSTGFSGSGGSSSDSEEEKYFAEAAVTPEWVINKEGTKGFVNRFASRVEIGEERIKKKKVKKKKKKKKEDNKADASS